jgi:syntaxin 18
MTDLTPILNELLKGHDARPTTDPALSLQHIDSFLKEAYEIVNYPAVFYRLLALLTPMNRIPE